MSPETIREEFSSPASDVWALGASVVEMGTGKPPWAELDKNEPMALMFHIGKGLPPDRPAYPSTLSDEATDFLNKCLCVDPNQRASCEDLLQHSFLRDSVMGVEDEDRYLRIRQTSGDGSAIMDSLVEEETPQLTLDEERLQALPEAVSLSTGTTYRDKPTKRKFPWKSIKSLPKRRRFD